MSARLPLVDALKALASQLIVLHHLAFYGPMSDAVRPWAADLVDGLSRHGRLAVQVFLVVAGFLAARALAPAGAPRPASPLRLVLRRWSRLAGPYAVAIGLAVLTAALARGWSDHPTVPDAPTAWQLVANLAMLQDVTGQDALSAGAWYVAIDLQLYACFALLMALAARSGVPGMAPVLVGAATLASLLAFNRDPHWDAWAPYFFGAYGLGALAAWAAAARRGTAAVLGLAALGALALWIEFRTRIAVAALTALLLAVSARSGLMARWPRSGTLAWLGRISFSVFLVHYPVIVLFEAAAARWSHGDPTIAALGIAAAWVASTAVGALFHRHVETVLVPRAEPAAGRRPAPAPAVALDDDAAAVQPPR